jgi:hypothetical protein
MAGKRAGKKKALRKRSKVMRAEQVRTIRALRKGNGPDSPFTGDQLAGAMARIAYEMYFEAHRGVFVLGVNEDGGPDLLVAFGNDGYGDEGDGDDRSRRQVALLRERLAAYGHAVVGFGLAGEGTQPEYTWALLVQSAPGQTPEQAEESIHKALWTAWRTVNGLAPDGGDIQEGIGRRVLGED